MPQTTMEFTPASLAAAAARGTSSASVGRDSRRPGADQGRPRALVVRPWNPNTSNWQFAFGKVFLGKSPVVGAQIRVDGFTLPALTGPQGGFSYPADITEPGRHEVRVVGLDRAKVGGRKLTTAQQNALRGARAGIIVGYRLSGLRAKVQSNGTVLVTGRITNSAGTAPPAVGLYTYKLGGTITDATGKPVQGAVVVGRTNDRDFWTFSSPSDANGHYTSLFHASDETRHGSGPDQPRRRARADLVRRQRRHRRELQAEPERDARHPAARAAPRTRSPGRTRTPARSTKGPPSAWRPAAASSSRSSARWPDAKGNFSMTLPASMRGKTISFWQNKRLFFSSFAATPGGKVDLDSWPSKLGRGTPSHLASLRVPCNCPSRAERYR